MYNDSTFEEIFDILTYYMTYNNQPLLTENQVKEVQQSIEKNIKKSDSQDIAINELELWYTTQADKPEFFDTVSLYFNYSLYRIKYPINMTDTGNGIYVGESPRLMPDYFWLLMEEQLKKVTSSETPKLRIISLEEGLDTQLLNKVRHPNFKNNVYWPTHNAEQKNNDEFPYSIIFKESNNTFENLTDYSLNLDTETAHYSTTLTHISGWPDGSIPYDFLNYRQVISKTIFELAKDIRTSTQLTYIHCQSGLGRSGVFRIALEYALSKIDNEQPNSPFKLVEAFREKYRYAVQTANQFQYLHDLCDDIDQIYEKEEVFLKGNVS